MPATTRLHNELDDTDALFEEFRRTRDPDVRNRLVERHLYIADRCAHRYRQRGEPLDDLRQVARVGLMNAVDRFDPDRNIKFETYAMPTVTGALRHHFRDNCWAVSAPRRAKELRSRVFRAVEGLSQQLGRQPEIAEIAESVDVDVDVVAETLDANQCFSTESWNPADDDVIDRTSSLASAVDPSSGAIDRVETASRLSRLDERLRRIVLWRFYEQCTQREIGERLGVGQVQVSRLLARAMAQLRAATDAAKA